MPPDVCPNCGEIVPEEANACPACGACEKTGWSDDAKADAIGIPSESFDYEDYIRREFEGEKPRRKFGTLWAATAVALLVLLAWAFLR